MILIYPRVFQPTVWKPLRRLSSLPLPVNRCVTTRWYWERPFCWAGIKHGYNLLLLLCLGVNGNQTPPGTRQRTHNVRPPESPSPHPTGHFLMPRFTSGAVYLSRASYLLGIERNGNRVPQSVFCCDPLYSKNDWLKNGGNGFNIG